MRKRVIQFLATALTLCAIAFFAKGMYHALLDPRPGLPIDLKLRWQEQQYIFLGKNPYVVADRWYAAAATEAAATQPADTGVDERIGVPGPGYPPWAYAIGAPLWWPPQWTAARWYHGILNALFLIPLGYWGYRSAANHSKSEAWLVTAGLLAISSICSTLGNGQYGIVALTALVGSLVAEQRNRQVTAGILLSIALVKPTLALPFVLPFLVKRRWITLFTAGGVLLVSSVIVWALTGTDPLTMSRQMVAASSRWGAHEGNDMVAQLVKMGVEPKAALRALAVVVTLSALVLSMIWRDSSTVLLFAIAAVAARLWTYHRMYDNLILAFLLVPLGVAALRQRPALSLVALAVGASLWLPPRINPPGIEIAMACIWIAGLCVLLASSQRSAAPEPTLADAQMRAATT